MPDTPGYDVGFSLPSKAIDTGKLNSITSEVSALQSQLANHLATTGEDLTSEVKVLQNKLLGTLQDEQARIASKVGQKQDKLRTYLLGATDRMNGLLLMNTLPTMYQTLFGAIAPEHQAESNPQTLTVPKQPPPKQPPPTTPPTTQQQQPYHIYYVCATPISDYLTGSVIVWDDGSSLAPSVPPYIRWETTYYALRTDPLPADYQYFNKVILPTLCTTTPPPQTISQPPPPPPTNSCPTPITISNWNPAALLSSRLFTIWGDASKCPYACEENAPPQNPNDTELETGVTGIRLLEVLTKYQALCQGTTTTTITITTCPVCPPTTWTPSIGTPPPMPVDLCNQLSVLEVGSKEWCDLLDTLMDVYATIGQWFAKNTFGIDLTKDCSTDAVAPVVGSLTSIDQLI